MKETSASRQLAKYAGVHSDPEFAAIRALAIEGQEKVPRAPRTAGLTG